MNQNVNDLVFKDTIRIRYVWTQIFLYPHKKNCGYKNLRIRVDGALIVLCVAINNENKNVKRKKKKRKKRLRNATPGNLHKFKPILRKRSE